MVLQTKQKRQQAESLPSCTQEQQQRIQPRSKKARLEEPARLLEKAVPSTSQEEKPRYSRAAQKTPKRGRPQSIARVSFLARPASNSAQVPMATMSDEQLAAARKDSSNMALKTILEESPMSSTVNQYKTYFGLWQEYWNEKYKKGDGTVDYDLVDYTVNAARMLEFFKAVMFKRTVRKFIRQDASYVGQVGLAPPPNKSPPDLEDAIALDCIGQPAATTSAAQDGDIDAYPEDHSTPEDNDDSEDQAEDLSEEAERDAEHVAGKGIATIEGSAQEANVNSYGRKVIEVPVGIETIKSARKALIYLWKQQNSRTAPYPNPAPNPRDDIHLDEAVTEYKTRLVYSRTTTGAPNTATYSIRDPYSTDIFHHMISFTWEMLLPIQPQGRRAYNAQHRFQHIREHLCLLARHHMLLRDDDIRNVRLSELFNIQTRHPAAGSALASGLVFPLTRGRINQHGINMYATAFRHKSFFRCTVAAFAFLMLERFEVEKEPIPDFSNTEEWHSIKLLTVGGTPEERLRNRTMSLTAKTQIDATTAVMRSCEVHSIKVADAGRRAGTSEANHLGLSLDHIQNLGRWSTDQMEDFHSPKNPIIGAFYMAHFNKTDEPYFIERDLVTPPLPLQRLIFSWIEHSFDNDMPQKTESWIKECNQEMEGVDPNVPTMSDLHSVPVEESTSTKRLTSKPASSTLVDRVGFLKLLVRMRRVILQDAVLYMKPDENGRTLTNSLITSLPHIFQSQLFLDFQTDLLRAMDMHHRDPNHINPNIQVDDKTVIQAVNTFIVHAQQRHESTIQSLSSLSSRIDQLTQHSEKVVGLLSLLLQQGGQEQAQTTWLEQTRHNAIQNLQQLLPCNTGQQQQHQPQSQPQPQPQPRPEPQPQQNYQPQLHEKIGDRVKGYMMLPDNGFLAVRQAWDEFHGPVAQALLEDRRWPFTQARQRAYRRRRQFIDRVKMEAKEKQQTIDAYLEMLEETYKGQTINSIRTQIELKQAQKKKE